MPHQRGAKTLVRCASRAEAGRCLGLHASVQLYLRQKAALEEPMSHHTDRAREAARRRAERILEIKPGTVTVYTAYLVVCIRLTIVVAHAIVPGLQ